MKYYVTFAINGTFTTEMEADSNVEAIDFALSGNVFPGDVDFGALENCEADLIQIDEENGKNIYAC